jgi:hypothetical protein
MLFPVEFVISEDPSSKNKTTSQEKLRNLPLQAKCPFLA